MTRLLGAGGMARVYLATLHGVGGFRKEVALKVLAGGAEAETEDTGTGTDAGTDADADVGMTQEARLSGLLKHPHIVDTYDFGEVNGEQFIVMEVIDGVSIRELVRQFGPLPPSVCMEIASQVCEGLEHAHNLEVAGEPAGLVHRDLTPGNIMVTRSGCIKLMDFGLAQMIRSSVPGKVSKTLRGTPPFMSPEQIARQPIDHRADLFSLGAILYEIFTGVRLFEAPTSVGILLKIEGVERGLSDSALLGPLDTVCPGLASLVRSCLRANPDQRVQSARDVRTKIEALQKQVDPEPTLRSFIEQGLSGATTQAFTVDEVNTWVGTAAIEGPDVRADRSGKTVADVLIARTNVGAERSHFVGRADDLAKVQSMFQDGAKLVTLLGPGGSGKTRLAHRHARCLLEVPNTMDKVWWCDLRTVYDLDGIVGVVAEALSLPMARTASEQVEHIGNALADRSPMTLILDNFEQISQLGSVSIGRWMALSSETRFLVTSQHRLALEGESCHVLGALSEKEAISLFCQRAESAGAEPVNLRADPKSLSQLVIRLDHHPLAIELAAAHARVFTPAQILERLSSRFQLLKGRRPSASTHHQSLEQALNWSWELLEPWEQGCLAQLSAFSGGFRMEDAEGVVDMRDFPDAPWVVFVVEALVDRSLVHATPVPGGQIRFEMSNAVQEYAEAQLGESRTDVWECHAKWYAQRGTIEYIQSLRVEGGNLRFRGLIQDRTNLLTAVDRAIANGWTESASLIGHAATVVLGTLGPMEAAAALGKRIRDLPDLSAEQRCRLLQNTSFYKIDDDPEGAIKDFEEAVELAKSLTNRTIEGVCLNNLSLAYHRVGEMDKALATVKSAISVSEKSGYFPNLATAQINLGNLYEHMGQIDDALESYTQALKMSTKLGDQLGILNANINLGDIHRTLGNPQRSREHLDRGIELAGKVNHARKLVLLLMNLVALDLDEDDFNSAATRIERAKRIAQSYDERRLIGGVLTQEAKLYLKRGELDEAHVRILEAEKILSAAASDDWLVWALCARADVELCLGEMEAARKTFARMLEKQTQMGVGNDAGLARDIDRLRTAIEDQDER